MGRGGRGACVCALGRVVVAIGGEPRVRAAPRVRGGLRAVAGGCLPQPSASREERSSREWI